MTEFCEERVVDDMVGGAEVVQALLDMQVVNGRFNSRGKIERGEN